MRICAEYRYMYILCVVMKEHFLKSHRINSVDSFTQLDGTIIFVRSTVRSQNKSRNDAKNTKTNTHYKWMLTMCSPAFTNGWPRVQKFGNESEERYLPALVLLLIVVAFVFPGRPDNSHAFIFFVFYVFASHLLLYDADQQWVVVGKCV